MRRFVNLKYFATTVLIGYLLYSFVINRFFAVYRIDQGSMEDTLYGGDKVLLRIGSKTARNDIVVFKHNGNTLAKRCVAMPGDTLVIQEGQVRVNGEIAFCPKTSKMNGKASPDKDIMIFDRFGQNWTMSDWGPVIIPRKGMSVQITAGSFPIYEKVIEGEHPETAYINALKEDGTYTFANDYFFALGDNRSHSDDSRVFGFVQMDSIVGSTNLVLFSKYSFSRFLKRLEN